MGGLGEIRERVGEMQKKEIDRERDRLWRK